MKRRDRGFTLLETVLALTLLATLLAALYGGLRTGLQSWEAGLARSARADDLLLSTGFLRREIASAFPWRLKDPMAVRLGFIGERDRLRLVSQRPAEIAGGGLAFVAFAFESGGSGPGRLAMRRAFAAADATDLSPLDSAEAFTLLAGVTAARFQYFGSDGDLNAPSWQDQWTATQRLPSHVRIDLELGERKLTPIVVALRLGEEAGCYESMFQRQCVPRR